MNKDISILKEIETYLTDKYKFTEKDKYRGVTGDLLYYLSIEREPLSIQMYSSEYIAHIDLNRASPDVEKFITDKVKGKGIRFFILNKGFIEN